MNAGRAPLLAALRGARVAGPTFAGLVATAAVAMLVAGANPVRGFGALLHGSIGSGYALGETLVATTSLLFPALAVTLAFRGGLFNIGAEGQLLVGGLCAGVAGGAFGGPGWIAIPLMLLAGAAGGGVYGAIPGVLRARFGGSEVIATLMLNIVAVFLATYLIDGPLHAPGIVGPETAPLPQTSWLPSLAAGTRLTVALPLALLFAVALRFVLDRTVLGYEIRASGEAPEAARRAGIPLGRTAVVTMLLSGAIAGVGGATIVAGVLHRFNVALSPGYGFIAIAVAIVGGFDPLRVVLASFVFGMLQSGGLAMQIGANVPKDVVAVVEGLAILAARRRARAGPGALG